MLSWICDLIAGQDNLAIYEARDAICQEIRNSRTPAPTYQDPLNHYSSPAIDSDFITDMYLSSALWRERPPKPKRVKTKKTEERASATGWRLGLCL